MLSEFLKQCQGFSKAQLDDRFGHASELVFIHIYAFLRLNYKRACSIALQLQVFRLFFEASSGSCFAHHFLASGGTTLLLELLKMQENLTPEDLLETMNTLLALTTHGPRAQQLMTETKIVEVFTTELPRFTDADLHPLTVQLFAQLAEGDEAQAEVFCNALRSKFPVYSMQKTPDALTTASHIFQILFSPNLAADCDVKNTISDFLALTKTDCLDVQRAGITIFQQLLDNLGPARQRFLFDVVIDLITFNADEIPPDLMDQRLLQQTFGVRLLQSVLAVKNKTAIALYAQIQKVLPALVRAIGNTQNFSAQKAACLVLARLVDKWPNARSFLTNAMPNEWATALLTRPQQFCLDLTPTQVDTFQGAEPSHFFFDLAQEPTRDDARRRLTEVKRAGVGVSTYIQQPIIMRPSALKYVPSGKPAPPRTDSDAEETI
jgi:hypothetical protein